MALVGRTNKKAIVLEWAKTTFVNDEHNGPCAAVLYRLGQATFSAAVFVAGTKFFRIIKTTSANDVLLDVPDNRIIMPAPTALLKKADELIEAQAIPLPEGTAELTLARCI